MAATKNGKPLILRQTPVDELIDRALEQRLVCLDQGMHETARTFYDIARFLVALNIASDTV